MSVGLRTGAGQTFASLRSRNYRLFYFGQLVSNTGNWLTNLALTLLVLHLTHSGVAVGALAACAYGPFLLFSTWAGALADRTSKRRLLLITQTLEMVQSVGLAALAFLPHPPVPGLFITAFIGGTLLAIDNPVRRSFVAELVPLERVANAVVLYTAQITTAQVVGPALAGFLVEAVSYGWCFLIDAMSYLFVIVALALIRGDELRRPPRLARAKGQLSAGIRYVYHHRDLRIVFVMMAVTGLFVYRWEVSLPLMFKDALDSTDNQFTLGFATFAVGSLLGALGSAHRGVPTMRRILVYGAAMAVALAAASAAPTLALAYPAVFVVGVTSIIEISSITAFVQVNAAPEVQGRVLALQSVLLMGSAPIGAPILGYLSDTLGGRAPLAASAGGAVVASALAFLMISRRRAAGSALPSPLPTMVRSST